VSVNEDRLHVKIESRWDRMQMTVEHEKPVIRDGKPTGATTRVKLSEVDLLDDPRRARKIAKVLGCEGTLRAMFEEHTTAACERAAEEAEREQKHAGELAARRVRAQQRADELTRCLETWT
jgi:hypothetical protein